MKDMWAINSRSRGAETSCLDVSVQCRCPLRTLLPIFKISLSFFQTMELLCSVAFASKLMRGWWFLQIKQVQFEAHGSRSQGAAAPSEAALLPPPPRGARQAPGAPQPATAAAGQPPAVAARAPGPGDSSEEEGFTVPDAAAIR